jgi:glycosyltransferase involved in cell wall biosynthesis
LLITAGWEGLPLSALEAMALGRPLIISDVGGNREAISADESGYLLPQRDLFAFVSAALDLINDPIKRQTMGEAGARRVQQHFSLQIMAAKVTEVYRSL